MSAAPPEPCETARRGWHGGGSENGELHRLTSGGSRGETNRQAEETNDELHRRGTAQRVALDDAPRTLPASEGRRRQSSLIDGAEVTSSEHQWRPFVSKRGGKGGPEWGREGSGEVTRSVGEKDDATELSLDLSDCSDEVGHTKFGELKRGRTVYRVLLGNGQIVRVRQNRKHRISFRPVPSETV